MVYFESMISEIWQRFADLHVGQKVSDFLNSSLSSNVAALINAVATIVLAIYAVRQIRILRRQSEILQQQTELVDRQAKISVAVAQLDEPSIFISDIRHENFDRVMSAKPGRWGTPITLTVENFGRSPGILIKIDFWVSTVEMPTLSDLQKAPHTSCSFHQFIVPSSSGSVPFKTPQLSVPFEAVERIKVERKEIPAPRTFIAGRLVFSAVTERLFETGFAFVSSPRTNIFEALGSDIFSYRKVIELPTTN